MNSRFLQTFIRKCQSMPPCDFVPKKYKGHKYEDLLAIRRQRLSPALTTFHSKPLVIQQGHKQWLFDIDGRRYLDMFGGICTVSVGHCHSEITKAAVEQMETLGHVSNVYIHPKIQEYAEKLTDKLPGDLKVVYFVNSGSEANDLAVLLARCYTNNFEVISLRNSYHGMTYQVMNLTATSVYRCKRDLVEPGTHFWGFEGHGIMPDVVTMAKGMGNGFPLAAVVTTAEIANALQKAKHFNTFGGNPVSCAVGIAVLDILEKDKLQKNSDEIGTYLLLELQKLRDEFSVVGDVRGKGLMIGVEMIDGCGSDKPSESTKMVKYWDRCKELGVLLGRGGYYGNVFRIKPPMCITKEDAKFTVDVMRMALNEQFSQ
ncbi:hypothetical protein FQA39_LY16356 [Lamprigera yunnana]|nr:hypothetical protein FQA39_LY16356 [Lamprigera yunnana]